MDRNSILGFGLLLVLLVGYIWYNQHSQMKYQAQKQKDSLEYVKKHPPKLLPKIDSNKAVMPIAADSIQQPELLSVIENEDIQITFTNKGGYATKAVLKKYKTHDGKPLRLFDGKMNSMDFGFLSTTGSIEHSKNYTLQPTVSSDKKSIVFQHPGITFQYTLQDKGYMMGMKVNAPALNPAKAIDLEWKAQSLLTELDIESEKLYSQVCYNLEKEGYDYYTIKEKEKKEWNEGIKWLCFKQHYFNATLITDNKIINSGNVNSEPSLDTATKTLTTMNANLSLVAKPQLDFKWYLGPNDYKTLKGYQIELEEIIPLSYGIFGFVKYINKWIILPIFNALAKVFSSYGIVILLLTFIIRLLMSPFTYKSYVSSAKMKALKPDMDILKAKYEDDKQAFGVEQMKLYREAGVNPLGGCLPALLQLPVFFALLSFFPHAIELRQQNFLWAKDLSTYDSILNLPFNIPFYGNHVSLFTILFVITSLLLALYSMNMNMGADQNNPMMKYLPFIMPVMFLGIFNKLPAALTYYYFVSNVITLGLQFVIQNYIIDPDKIHAQIQAKRSAPPKENKLMKRMMEMQQQNQERLKKK